MGLPVSLIQTLLSGCSILGQFCMRYSMDSGLESDGEGEGEINYDIAEITTCLELFNSNRHEDLFEREKGKDFIKLAKDLLKFHKENSDFFCEING